jgi:hypothetical protein
MKQFFAILALFAVVVSASAQDTYSRHAISIISTNVSISAATTNSGADLHAYVGTPIFLLTYTNTAGTTPTMTVYVDQSANNSSWTNVTSFAMVTNSSAGFKTVGVAVGETGPYYRTRYALTGSGAAYTASVAVIGVLKYQ